MDIDKDVIFNHKIKYKPKIGLSKKIKFGIEIEALGDDFIRNLRDNRSIYYYKHNPAYKPSSIYDKNKWILYHEDTLFDEDGNSVKPSLYEVDKMFFDDIISYDEYNDLRFSSYNGGELASPILKDNYISWLSLKRMIEYMKKNVPNLRVNESCSCHNHFDIGIFDNPEVFYHFIILLAENEDVLTRFYCGEFINLREITKEWAKPIKPLIRFGLDLEMDTSSFKSLIRSIYLGNPKMKEYTFDFWEIYNNYYKSLSTTFENRVPNGSLSLPIIQNNIMLMGFLMEYVASGKYDVERGINRLKNNVSDPFYVADMLPNEEAKLDFLSQYYKDGNYVKSKKLIKSKRVFY